MSFFIHLNTLFFTVTCLSLTACSDNTADTEAPVDTITFEDCIGSAALQCGSFEVPLIHGSTDSRRISIDVARLPGIGDGPHEPLLLNFGGPGSGIEVMQEFAEFDDIPDSIREHYDIISFDQRGVSNPLREDCDQLGNAESNPYPRDMIELQELIDDSIMLANACSAEYADELRWVGSNSVVQDMDAMRALLGTPKLHIVGSSFGTRITALYLERYPENSGRIVLDAPLRPTGTLDSLWVDTAAAEQASFELMLNACGSSLPNCDRSTIEAAFVSRINSLLDNEDEDIAGAFFQLMAIAIEESDVGELLAPFLIDFALNGDPTDLFEITDQFGLNEEDEGDEESGFNSSITLERAVLCADDSVRPTVESLALTLNTLNEASDFFGEALLPVAASCVGWPVALDPMNNIQTSDAPVALVIGGTEDVRTPIEWAVEMAEAIGGVFVSSDHLGHTTFLERSNECIDSLVGDFLIDGSLPAAGTVCN